MNVKIQGGGAGTYSNSGSCSNVVEYLEHEDKKQLEQGNEIEPFFNHKEERANASQMIKKLDENKGQLLKTDAKFFVLTISPSEKEINAMGKTPEEQSRNFKEFIKGEVMEKYAQNFNKDLKKDDLLYYSKIHIERKGEREKDMHAHIIVSRKTADNRIKISPQSNHKGTSKGAVKGGFNRVEFFNKIENSFDTKFEFKRDIKESFEYQNTLKNGTVKDIETQLLKAKAQEESIKISQEKVQQQQKIQSKGLSR